MGIPSQKNDPTPMFYVSEKSHHQRVPMWLCVQGGSVYNALSGQAAGVPSSPETGYILLMVFSVDLGHIMELNAPEAPLRP